MTYGHGDRVKLVSWETGGWDENKVVPPGTLGTIDELIPSAESFGQRFWVKWDNGAYLCVLDTDVVEKVSA